MLNAWWERWPGRLDDERRKLTEAGIPHERDEEAWRRGVLQLRLKPTIQGRKITLFVVFPDVYPYTRFEIFAPELDLNHHQNPFQKNLCLIGRATENWSVNDTLADFVQNRLPKMLLAAEADETSAVAAIEEHQAEPLSSYYPYRPNTMILIDGGWSLDPTAMRGELVLGLSDEPRRSLRAAVIEIRNDEGLPLEKANLPTTRLYTTQLKGRWLRLQKAIRIADPPRFLEEILRQDPSLKRPRWKQLGNLHVDVVGVLFPEEIAWRESGEGWVFLVRSKDRKGGGHAREEVYFARAERAGRDDLASRIPELRPLRRSRIVVVGLGSLGAPSAIEFARAGAGELRVVDDDVVGAGTTVRWPLGLSAAGRTKVEVLKQFIELNYPYTDIKTWIHRIGSINQRGSASDSQVLDELLDSADLVYDTTAEIGIQLLLSDLAAERQIPYLCVSTTPGAWGGLIARISPSSATGCWGCLEQRLNDGSIPTPPTYALDGIQPHGCADPTFTGASFDVTHVALAGVRLAVATLCARFPRAHPNFDWDVAVISLRDASGSLIAPRWRTFPLIRHPSCSCAKTAEPHGSREKHSKG